MDGVGIKVKEERGRSNPPQKEYSLPFRRSGCQFLIFAEDFLYSGSSALLLLVANLFPAYWYVSFVALTPFLWRVSKATPKQALRLGGLLGATFFLFSSTELLSTALPSTLLKISLGTLLFALWGWGVGLTREYFGFNPIIVAGLWVFFELGLVKLGYTTDLLVQAIPSDRFFWSLTTLVGLGFISFALVLINTLIVSLIEYIANVLRVWNSGVSSGKTYRSQYESNFLVLAFVNLPQLRGPPSGVNF